MILTSNKKEKESHINTEFSSLFGLLDMAEQQVDVLLCRGVEGPAFRDRC